MQQKAQNADARYGNKKPKSLTKTTLVNQRKPMTSPPLTTTTTTTM
jgi:hypothetical protein